MYDYLLVTRLCYGLLAINVYYNIRSIVSILLFIVCYSNFWVPSLNVVFIGMNVKFWPSM